MTKLCDYCSCVFKDDYSFVGMRGGSLVCQPCHARHIAFLNKPFEKEHVTTTQTNEEIKSQLYEIFLDFMGSYKKFLESKELPRTFSISYWEDKIMSLIPQPEQSKEIIKGDFEDSCPHCKKAIYVLPRRLEQIEVEIVDHPIVGAKTILYKIVCVGNFNIDFLDKFYLKQEAIDFCHKHGLKIINETGEDV